MGKKRQYKDDYTGDVKSIRQHHKKLRALVSALCVTGIIAAGGATYVLMNPAQTMTKEGIDEMDPNEDFIVSDDDVVQADAFFEDFEGDEQSYVQEENYDDVPLIEEVNDKEKKPADAIPAEDEDETEDAHDADDAVLAGGIAEDMIVADQADTAEEVQTEAVEAPAEEVQTEAVEAPAEEVQTEAVEAPAEEVQTEAAEAPAEEVQTEAVEAPAEEVQTEAVEAPAEEVQTEATEEAAAAEIVGASETEASETLMTEAVAVETEEAVPETEAAAAETEGTVAETEVMASETEEAAETEAVETESVETEAPETEEAPDEAETEALESETQGSEIREKSKDDVYVETEGEKLDEKWIDSVGLEIKTEDGWDSAETAESGTIVVDADQTLRFRVTYTVQPETLSQEMRTLIYQIPKEVTSVDESYGEIVDADERVIANYAIDNTGVIRVTFTEEIAELNAEGTKITCKIEFKTQASNLVQ